MDESLWLDRAKGKVQSAARLTSSTHTELIMSCIVSAYRKYGLSGYMIRSLWSGQSTLIVSDVDA